MSDSEAAAIDAHLQTLLVGDETSAIPALLAIGQPALERLLDVAHGRLHVSSTADQRVQQEV